MAVTRGSGRTAGRRRPSSPPGETPERFDLVVLAPGDALSGAQLVASYAGATVVTPFETRGGEAGQRMRRIVELAERIRRALDGRSPLGSLPREREMLRYGAALFETLFPGDVRRLWDAACARAQGAPVELVFTSALDWIADKPWEFAWDPSRKAFLATGAATFVRNVFSAVPAEAPRPRRGPLRILFATARPSGTPPLSAEKEEEGIRRAFEPHLTSRRAALDVLPGATVESLHARLRGGRYDVLHFVGHGEYDETERSGALLLDDGHGKTKRLSAAALSRLATGRGLLLAFLNACESGRGGRYDFLRGVAPALAHAGLPAVAANQFRVFDDAAAAFAASFYAALAEGFPVGSALREARVGLGARLGDAALDWAVPVLFARDPRAVLCRPGASS